MPPPSKKRRQSAWMTWKSWMPLSMASARIRHSEHVVPAVRPNELVSGASFATLLTAGISSGSVQALSPKLLAYLDSVGHQLYVEGRERAAGGCAFVRQLHALFKACPPSWIPPLVTDLMRSLRAWLVDEDKVLDDDAYNATVSRPIRAANTCRCIHADHGSVH
jgi:hypothetical protein